MPKTHGRKTTQPEMPESLAPSISVGKPEPLAWAAWDTPDRIAAHPDIRNETGDARPRLLLITFDTGALKIAATRRPPMMLADAVRIARAMRTLIDSALVSKPEVKLGWVASTLVKRLRLDGHRYIGGGTFENLPVETAVAMLASIRDIAELPPGPAKPVIPAFLRKESEMHEMHEMHEENTTGAWGQETSIVQFSFESLPMRIVMGEDGEPWFVAADVCAVLELPNTTRALARLDPDEQALISIQGISRGNDQVNVVNEPGLYSLVLGSRKPEAKRFKRWVTHEVLPAIRKTGAYALPGSCGGRSLTGHQAVDEAIEFRAWREADEMRRLLLSRLDPTDPVSVESIWTMGNRVRISTTRKLVAMAKSQIDRGVPPKKVSAWIESVSTETIYRDCATSPAVQGREG